MTEFKVGDHVRLIAADEHAIAEEPHVGAVGRIACGFGDGIFSVRFDGLLDTWQCESAELELIPADALADDDIDDPSHIWHERMRGKRAAENIAPPAACDHMVINTQPDGIYCTHCGQRLIPFEEQEMRQMKARSVPLLETANLELRDQIRDLEHQNAVLRAENEKQRDEIKALNIAVDKSDDVALDRLRKLRAANQKIDAALSDLEAIATGMTGDYSPAPIANIAIAKLTTDK